jgi:hypothetical protein
MAYIEEILGQGIVLRVEMDIPTEKRSPTIALKVGQVRYQISIRPIRIPHPHPYDPVPLLYRIADEVTPRWRAVLPRRINANSVPVEYEPVITALQLVITELAPGQGIVPVRAAVLECCDRPVLAAKHDNGLPHDEPAQGFRQDFLSPAGDIPEVE